MIDLILTVDYELFGNGSGDVRRDVVEPTDRLLAICERYGAKLTLMFEVAEYWAFKHAEMAGTLDLGYSPAGEMETQAQEAVRRGHDVQLHVHPQWVGAELRDGIWQLNFRQMRMSDLPDAGDREQGDTSARAVLEEGKRTLEGMLRPIDPGYECLAFRAGGFCIQPAAKIIQAMRDVGLRVDTSVVGGLRRQTPCPIDFSEAAGRVGYWWTTRSDVVGRGQDGEGVMEMPVYTEMKPYLYNLKYRKLAITLKRRALERRDPQSKVAYAPQSASVGGLLLRKLFSMHAMKFDFCKLSKADMRAMFATAVQRMNEFGQPVRPLVCIGHSKDFWNDSALEAFFDAISSRHAYRGSFRWSTLRAVAKRILSSSTESSDKKCQVRC
jgi:hypothetical protein